MAPMISRLSIYLLLTIAFSLAKNNELNNMLVEIGEEATPQYIAPIMATFGSTMNYGWQNSSKPLTFMGLPMGISIGSATMAFGPISNSMRSADLKTTISITPELFVKNVEGLSSIDQELADILPSEAHLQLEASTIYGSKKRKKVTLAKLFKNNDELNKDSLFKLVDQKLEYTLPFQGIIPGKWWGSIPNFNFFTIGLNKIPIINNIQASVTYIPTSEWESKGLGLYKFDFFNYKIQHEFLSHIPFFEQLNLIHGSVYWARNWLALDVGDVNIELDNWTTMLHASLDTKRKVLGFGGFLGVGVESSGMTCHVKENRKLDLPGFTAKVDPKRFTRYQIGARFSVYMVDIWAEYNFGQTSAFALGASLLSFNGL